MLILIMAASSAAGYPRPSHTERVSLADSGAETHPREGTDATKCPGGYGTHDFDVSLDGRHVAFTSSAPDVVNGDGNDDCDVFVRDVKKDLTRRISMSSDGAEGTGLCPMQLDSPGAITYRGSTSPSISADGRFVAFLSCAANLVPGDTNLARDVFVHDTKTGTTKRVSVSSKGDESFPATKGSGGNGLSISADGRHVAFYTAAGNLVDPPSSGIVVHHVRTGETELVSQPDRSDLCRLSTICVANGTNVYPSISGDGRYVVYSSCGASRGCPIYVVDTEQDRARVANLTTDGSPSSFSAHTEYSNARGTESHGGRQISSNGRWVVFSSTDDALVPNDTNALAQPPNLYAGDVFVRDLDTGRTERISVSPYGEQGYGSNNPAISSDGRLVTFNSHVDLEKVRGIESPEPPDPDINRVYVFDRLTGAQILASRSSSGDPRGGWSGALAGGPSMRYAVFDSRDGDVVEGDVNGRSDIFLHNLGPDLGTGALHDLGFRASPGVKDSYASVPHQSADAVICVGPHTCIPPGAAVAVSDDTHDLNQVLTRVGANLYGASIAYRPEYSDLFAAIELEHMPQVIPGLSPIFYGLRFEIEDKRYEVRATSLLGGTFGLFDCTDSPTCMKVADLRGGYGTTGERVVLSLPLGKIGLDDGGELSDVEAFSGLGSFLSGATKFLDTVPIR